MGSRVYDIAFKLNGAVAPKFTGSMLSASQTVGALGQKISQLEKSKSKVDRFGALKKEILETERRFFEAQNESKALAAQIAATAKPTKKLQGQFEAANCKAKKLKTSLGEQRTSLSELRREMSSAGIKTGQLVKHNQKLAQSIDLARRKQEKLQKVMMKQKALQDKRSGMQGKLFDAAAVGAAVAFPTMISARFEQSMAEVKALTGATGKDFQDLTAKARLLGSTTSFSASEAAQGMKYLGMAGFDTQQIIAAMPGVLNMAKAGAVDLGMASDIASDIMSGFGLKASEMGRVSDVLTKTFTSSNTSLEMLGETMKYVAPVASKAGMSLEETSAMAGLLGNVGIKASMAGTTLKGMVLGIAAPSTEAATAMQRLGISTADAQGNLRPMTDILGDISKATKDMGNAEKLDIVKTIFGKVSAAGLTELLTQAGENGIEEYIKKVQKSKGAADQIAKVMDNTTVGALKGLGSAAEGLAIVFGNTLTPAITATAHGLAFITRGLTAAAEKFPNATKVVGLLTGGTIALTTAAVAGGYAWTFVSGGLLQAQKMFQLVNLCMNASTIKTVALSGVQKAAAIGTHAMTAAQWALNLALNANPIGLVIAGVAALAGLAVVLYKKFEPFQKLVDSIWAKIKKLLKIGAKFFGFGGGEEADKAAKVGEVAATLPSVPDNVVPFPGQPDQGVAPVKFPEVSPSAVNSASTSIEYKPQIHIAATGSNVTEFKAAADQSLMESEERFRKMQAEVNHDDRRRAFG
ncbi:hypothetical protein DSLASN_01360 [Desulfoluna limicola]|uniref:Phage tail tape measure protein domain-containing protein n=1 Tax=Desulfoluna limicola TaxID=2810562 RepID=A0ABN6EVZ0_9BACT|nr:phage tail tape measure protein [Desulfoluna limicola]BCS94504.1 hypothetical protein DSLASN_01360 [Desulfoluna limicola]